MTVFAKRMIWQLLMLAILCLAGCGFHPTYASSITGNDNANSSAPIRTLIGHTAAVSCIAVSADSRTVLSGGEDDTLRLWNLDTGMEKWAVDEQLRDEVGEINGVAISPDGDRAVTCGFKSITFWSMSGGKRLHSYDCASNSIFSVAYTPDGRWIVAACEDGMLRLVDIYTGQTVTTFVDTRLSFHAVAVSPTGRTCLSGSWGPNDAGQMQLWNLRTGEEIRTFNVGNWDAINAVAFSPDGRTALSGSEDGQARLWNVYTGKLIGDYELFDDPVTSIAFGPDGKTAIAGCADHTVKVWNLNTGRELQIFSGHSREISGVAFTSDGTMVISASKDTTLKVWDATPYIRQNSSRTIAEVSPQQALGAASRPSDDSPAPVLTLVGHTGGLLCVAVTPGGRTLLSGGGDDTLRSWDLSTGTQNWAVAEQPPEFFSYVHCMAISPDGSTVATGGLRLIKLWDVATGKEIREFQAHRDWVFSLAFSPDGKTILSGSQDSMLNLWDARSGNLIRMLTPAAPNFVIHSVAISPDGCTGLAAGGGGNSAAIIASFNLKTGAEIRRFDSVGQWSGIESVAFSSDSHTALSGGTDKIMRLWDISTGKVIRTFEGHTDWVNSVAFSLDGRTALSGSSDKTIKLWDLATGKEIQTFAGDFGSVNCVVFMPDGKRAISANSGTVKLWDLTSYLPSKSR